MGLKNGGPMLQMIAGKQAVRQTVSSTKLKEAALWSFVPSLEGTSILMTDT
jgi:hypothetical protein